jgi:hypothetical protein
VLWSPNYDQIRAYRLGTRRPHAFHVPNHVGELMQAYPPDTTDSAAEPYNGT